MNTNREQPLHEGVGPNIWSLVIGDMKARDAIGAKKYNKHLRAFDGRSSLTDAYQEALDLAVYLRQKIEEDKVREAAADAITKANAAWGHGAVQVVDTWSSDGLCVTTFYVGARVDAYAWHEHGRGSSWDEAFAAAGVK